jgi:hypothetical protein
MEDGTSGLRGETGYELLDLSAGHACRLGEDDGVILSAQVRSFTFARSASSESWAAMARRFRLMSLHIIER